ncbi:DNA repair protein SWI5 homolog [Apteryx rowi]|uniref:DNA repair protein SWI5 homolog n=1 Tax=Apteryx rowi TaxID=308060 RepID=UPI000E1DEBF5|nr:DNA repair protein SWI5 homolog [Apteryx rowi]
MLRNSSMLMKTATKLKQLTADASEQGSTRKSKSLLQGYSSADTPSAVKKKNKNLKSKWNVPSLSKMSTNNDHRPPPPGSPPGAGNSGSHPLPRPLPRRTPGGARRSGTAGFKSPIPSPRSCQPNGASEEALQYEIEELKQKDLALDQEIAQFLSEGYSLEELEKHISLLHEYNDIKDAGQMLLGKLAVIRGVTTKQLYPEYDLELSD